MTDAPGLKEVIQRYEGASFARSNWEANYQEVYRYCMPERERFYGPDSKNDGERLNIELFTSIPLTAMEDFANSMLSTLTPHEMPWVELDKVGGGGREDLDDEESQALDEMERKTRDAIEESNFATEAVQSYMDLGAGTACIRIDQGDMPGEKLRFTSVPLGDLFLEEGPDGGPTTVFWRRAVTLRRAIALYGEDKFRKYLDDTESDTRVLADKLADRIEIIDCCIHVPDKVGEPGKKWQYYCCLFETKFKKKIAESYNEMSPYVVARWSLVKPELYGRGPGWMALPDIKAYNKLMEYIFRRTHQAVSPVLLAAPDGMFNPSTANVKPGTMLTVAATDPNHGPPLKAVELPGDFQIAEINQERMVQQINNIMLVEDFKPLEGGTKSREEVNIRHQDFLRRVGAVYPRLLREWLVPMIRRIMWLLDKQGVYNDIMVGAQDVVYKPGKAIGERQATAAAVEKLIGIMGAITQNPMLAAVFDVEKLPTRLADTFGVPKNWLKTPEQMAQMAQQAGEAAQGAQAMQEQQGQAAGVRGGPPPPATQPFQPPSAI